MKNVAKLSVLSFVVGVAPCMADGYADPVFYVTNPSGGLTNDLTECVFTKSSGGTTTPSSWSEFAASKSGTLVKQGTGWITVTSDLGRFSGEIHVTGGVWDVCHTNGIGSYLGGAAYVHDGATLLMERKDEYMTWIPPYDDGNTKAIIMEGVGAAGMGGALVARSTGQSTSDFFPFSRYPTLSGDATILIDQVGAMLNWRPAGIFRLNGHTLTFKGDEKYQRPLFCHNATEVEAGNIVCDNITHMFVDKAILRGGSGYTNTILGGSSVSMANVKKSDEGLSWTLDYRDAKEFAVSSGGYDGFAADTVESNRNAMAWFGPILLGCEMRLSNVSGLSNEENPNKHKVGLNLNGPISGDHGISLVSSQNVRYRSDIALGLWSTENTFTGAVALGDGCTLALWANGALPANGGGAAITNGAVHLKGGDVYSLPTLAVHGAGYVEQKSLSGGKWTRITKTGSGNLDYNAIAGADLLDVREGGVRFLSSAKPRYDLYAGLSEWTNFVSFKEAMVSGEYWQSSITSLTVRAACTSGRGAWVTDHVPKDSATPGTNMGLSYRGYIWNNSGETQEWTLAAVMDKAARVLIDGEVVLDQTERNEAKTANVTVTPGAHSFEFRYYNTSGNLGATAVTVTSGNVFKYIDDVLFDYASGTSPCYAVTDNGDGTVTTNGSWISDFGFAVDRKGRRSHFHTDYEPLIDPGDGSLFTTTTNLSDVVRGLDAAFGVMRFAAGTTLDLCNPVVPYRAIALEGVPSVYGGDLEIAESWTLSAGDVEAGYRLSTNGRLLFMKGVTIRVTTEDFIHRPPEGGWVIAEAEGGISLPEDWRSGVEIPGTKYGLALSQDGKRLMLAPCVGLIISIR